MAAPDGIVGGSITEDQGLRRLDEVRRARRWWGPARAGERDVSAWARVAVGYG